VFVATCFVALKLTSRLLDCSWRAAVPLLALLRTCLKLNVVWVETWLTDKTFPDPVVAREAF
jgi:hypothetical protein